ncbi:MAG: recombination protein RecR [Acidobacteria bacterium]|nr:recombination protein RecR [Acidobacteriota bacterium]
MPEYAKPMAKLIDELKRLPGVGSKSAQRMAFHLLKVEDGEADRLADAIRELKSSIRLCEICNNITEASPCGICNDASRDPHVLCVVEDSANIVAIEQTGHFRGGYHVLMGVLSPLHGVGPDQLRIEGLVERVKQGGIQEVVMATNPTSEGEATAMYLAKLLRPLGARITRIATGVPVGSELEYVDRATMARAMDGRKDF